MSGAVRITEAYAARLADELTTRDRAIIASFDRVRVATAKQIERLHFTGPSARANTRQTQQRLLFLTERRILAVLERRIGGEHGGSAHPVYALDAAGQRLASIAGPAGGLRIRRPWTPGTLFLRHALAVTELFVGLTETGRAGTGELLAFDAEPLCWRRYVGVAGGRSVLRPDAFVRFGRGATEYVHFVEVDRATASLAAVSRKLDAYRRYWRSGREQARAGVFPKVLILVPSEVRREGIVGACGRQPADAWPLFRVALSPQAVPILTGEEA